MSTNFKNIKSNLTAKQKQRINLAIIVGILGALALLTFVFSPKNAKKDAGPAGATSTKESVFIDNKMMEKSAMSQLEKQKKEMEEFQKKIDLIEKGNSPSQPGLPTSAQQSAVALQPPVNPAQQKVDQAISHQQQQLQSPAQAGRGANVASTAIQRPGRSALPDLPPMPKAQDGLEYKTPPPPGHKPYYPQQADTPHLEKVGGIGIAQNDVKRDAQKGDDSKKKEKRAVYLPPSFMPATLLSGLNAPTTENGKGNPVPLIIRVSAPAVLPNEVSAQLSGCFVIAEAVGSLADERAHCRTVSLACLSKKGQAVIDQPITGFIQDSDGQVGMAGRVVTKFGATVARSMMAGFFGGLGSAMSQSTLTNSISPLGQTQSIGTSGPEIAMAVAGQGISNAAKEIQKFYMDLAHASMPVIEVGNGKSITIVITKGTNLEIKNYKPVPWN
jgi:conjugal transfer pilus assembly protein TraB